MNKKTNHQRYAFFDIDGTVLRWSVFLHVVDYLFDQDCFPAKEREKIRGALKKWQDRHIEYDEYLYTAIHVFENNIEGVPLATLREAGKSAFEKYKDKVYVFTREFVLRLKEAGYRVIAISPSPKAALDPFCEYYGFDKVYGRKYAVDVMGYCTSEVMDLDVISSKDKVIESITSKEGGDLEGSISVGDTLGDARMFEVTDHAVLFNPTQELVGRAEKEDWDIVAERKDWICPKRIAKKSPLNLLFNITDLSIRI